jgi:hypothetical protein
MKQYTIPADASLVDRNIKAVIPPSNVTRKQMATTTTPLRCNVNPHGAIPC